MIIATYDFETMGLSPKAPLLSLGYVIGDMATGEVFKKTEFVIPAEFNTKGGRHIEPGTLLWWLEKSKDNPSLAKYLFNIVHESCNTRLNHLDSELNAFSTSLLTHKVNGIFCTDKSFDYPFLLSLYHAQEIYFPISYRHSFETRYMSQRHPELYKMTKDGGVAHRAVDDALSLFKFLHLLHSSSDIELL